MRWALIILNLSAFASLTTTRRRWRVRCSGLIVWGCLLPFIVDVNMNAPLPSVLSCYFRSCLSFLFFTVYFLPYFLFHLLHFLPPSLPPLPPRRHLTSVSWDRLRRRMSTACSAGRWEPFTCLAKLSALLRSWLSISWGRATRSVKPVCATFNTTSLFSVAFLYQTF